ncbi:PepSY domain-containing protein [Alkalibacterium sp. MB6]|uniref:PepSY domain-containing protein n=1 Tax=Alkalibacterium sp. MB6 TaxID=2081965 RepID=UPI00137B16D0|nr:PepSY domain-containing protein [Alkalibacterium sp. MB6]
MKLEFNTSLLNNDLTTKTHTVNGHKNIIVRDDNEYYSYEEIKSIAEKAIETDRMTYGWEVKFKDTDNQLKEVFIRAISGEKCNETTSSKQSLEEWIDSMFDKDDKQTSLF